MSLPASTQVVLGNHDLSLIVTYTGARKLAANDTFNDILDSPKASNLIDWLRARPLLVHDNNLGVTLTHAGILPAWDLPTAQNLAREVETRLRSSNYAELCQHLFGNEPSIWHNELTGWERYRFIINTFTRMRYCKNAVELFWGYTGNPLQCPHECQPWFSVPQRQTQHETIVFGHWAALQGKTNTPNVHAIDTGCAWGNQLTALCLDTGQRYSY